MSERLDLPCVSYRLGRWQDALADVDACDVVLTDPPYSERTHDGERGMRLTPDETAGRSRKPLAGIGYESLKAGDVGEFLTVWSERCRWWSIIFGDHTSFRGWESAWSGAGWVTFAPVIWHKRGAAPRFSGDGPASVVEYICVSRPRRRVREHRSRAGLYQVHVGPHNPQGSATGVVGTKDPRGLKQIIEDYTRPGDLVVDPYAGTATVGQACIETGRRYIGSEVDSRTYALGVKRLRAATPCLPGMEPDRWREKPSVEQETLF